MPLWPEGGGGGEGWYHAFGDLFHRTFYIHVIEGISFHRRKIDTSSTSDIQFEKKPSAYFIAFEEENFVHVINQ